MKTLLAFVAALTLGSSDYSRPVANGQQVAMLCLKTGEQISGVNRICFYSCAGSPAAITVSVAQMCPMSINQ